MSGTVEQIGTARPPGAPTPVAVPAAAPTATEAITAVAPAGRFPRRLAMLLAVHVLNFLALLGTVVLGMWGHAALWTLPALAFFVLTWLLLVPVVLIRGMPVGFEERFDKEYRQTITRMLVGSVVEAYAISMVSNLPTVALPYIAVSHLWWGATLLPIIFYLYWPKHDLAARLVSALSDNVAFTLILLSNRTYAAGVWPMYLWAALGNGFRFGIRPLVYNLVLGVLGFAFVVWETPAWRAMPALTVGLFLAQIFLPLYASGLIRRLHEATDAAKKANEAKTRFIAVMSHELRTPLSAMLGTVGVLHGSEMDEDQRRLLHVISGSGQSLLSMINELLDFSAIDSGKANVDIQEVPLYEVLSETVAGLANSAEEKGLRLGAHIDCRLPPFVRTDREHVRRITTNLVWNAIKFTKTGRIDVGFSQAANGALVIDVEDTGVGIAPEKQAKIFEPFVQGDDRVERAYEGVGLGLAIVRELVSLHRGRIAVKSQLNIGSRFTVELPIGAVAGEPPPVDAHGVVAFVAGSGPLASGGLIESCRAIGLQTSFVDGDPIALKRALGKAGKHDRPVVFLSHRDMATGGRVTPELFEALVAIVEGENAVPVLVLGDADTYETADFYRLRAAATIKAPSRLQLGNAIRFAETSSPTRLEAEAEQYVAQRASQILVVEDNATNRFIMERALGDAGHHVAAAPSGDDALNMLEKDTFDVVIMDINMPGLNGFETTKIIRAVNYSENLRIVGLTADVTSETKRRCLEAGMDLVLTKPAAITVMLKAIDDLVATGVASVPTDKVTPIEANARFRAKRLPIVDENGFQRLKEIGGEAFIVESVTLFLAEAVDLLSELESALNAYDRARAYDVFHSLRGICANVGAMKLREAVNTARDAENLVSDRYAHMGRLREELKAFQIEITKRIPDLEVVPLPFG